MYIDSVLITCTPTKLATWTSSDTQESHAKKISSVNNHALQVYICKWVNYAMAIVQRLSSSVVLLNCRFGLPCDPFLMLNLVEVVHQMLNTINTI